MPTTLSGISYASGNLNRFTNNSYSEPIRNSQPYLAFEELHPLLENASKYDECYEYEHFDSVLTDNGSKQEDYYSTTPQNKNYENF